MPKTKVEISTATIVKAVLIGLAFWFVYLLRDIVLLFFISIIIAAAIDPLVDKLHRKKIPRSAGVLGIYLVLLLLLSLAFSFMLPPIVSQLKEIAGNFPGYVKNVQETMGPITGFFEAQHINVGTQEFFTNISNSLSNLSKNVFSTTLGVFSGLISTIAVLSLVFYMAVEEKGVEKLVHSITPRKHHKYAVDLAERIKDKIGKWMLGQVFLMFVVFLLDLIGLYLIGVPFALILAVFAGIMEIVPYVGPIISAVPGVILGFLVSPLTGFLALAVYIIVQQAENHILTPQIMKKAVGLNPVIIILVLLVGAKLGGVLGAVISVPLATAVSLFVSDISDRREA